MGRARRLCLLGAAAIWGCSGLVGNPGQKPGPTGNGGGGGGGGGGSGPTSELCTGSETIAPKRLIRLSFNQLANTVASLLGPQFRDQVVAAYGIGDATARTFPPLLSPREGLVLIDGKWEVGDNVANAAGQYVASDVTARTGCATPLTDACAQQWLLAFAQKTYRRPLDDAEKATVTKVYADLKTTLQDPATPAVTPRAEALQYSVYAVMSAPAFLYRTELGTGAASDGTLAPYEIADQLAYFLTDAPADPPLLAAAASGKLADPAGAAAEADRLLATPDARANLEQAVFAYFSLQFLNSVVIDAAKVPGISVDEGLIDSMYTESERFLSATLWGAPLADLITSRRTSINGRLAALYGISPFPPAGATVDAAGFAPVELPATRAGLLTQAGFLTARARPNVPSVVGRGLAVNAFVLCGSNPNFPAELATEIDMVSKMLANETEREKAAYRADTSRSCAGCHPGFDPYGLALENFDIIGRYRTADEMGRAIDASVTLPSSAGGASVANALEMGQRIAGNGAFARCMARNFIQFALADGQPVPIGGCAVDAVAKAFVAGGDLSFSRLMREIAVSKTLALRTAGGM